MTNLTPAHQELFKRAPDECYDSLEALLAHCERQKEASLDRWQAPQHLEPRPNGQLQLAIGNDGEFHLNDWSFSQLCRMCGVAKDTVNRLRPPTVAQVFRETMPEGRKPLQILTEKSRIRSIHGTQYTRLWNADLLQTVRACATDFQPPQKASSGGTGLYAGEQDLFGFLIDPVGWVEIGDQAFAPGFFVWNSEVSCRSLGIETFWFQAACANHIVWDATEVVSWSQRHTARIHDGLETIRKVIEALVAKRDQRRDSFAEVIEKATHAKLGDDADEVLKQLRTNGIPRSTAKKALNIAEKHGAFTIWSVVDALTRIAAEKNHAGDRTEADQKASRLLELVA